MDDASAGGVYVVAATDGWRIEYWAAAMPRKKAAAEVQQVLPLGWKAVVTGWRLTPEKIARLKIRANTVCKLKQPEPA